MTGPLLIQISLMTFDANPFEYHRSYRGSDGNLSISKYEAQAITCEKVGCHSTTSRTTSRLRHPVFHQIIHVQQECL